MHLANTITICLFFFSHNKGVCLIGSETVTTFDGLFYNASFSGCDQVLTKDCSGRYKFAVLSRVEGDKKIVTVLLNKEKI
ncbi:Vitellogenin fused with superoxide dismutase, partial [Daphnia magna]